MIEFVAITALMQIQQNPKPAHRSRWPYLAFALLVLILGYSARYYSAVLPAFIGTYAPDTLWALLVFLLIASVKPGMTTWRTALIALFFTYTIELSQCYQAPWINHIRATRLGGLVLGHGFLWSDVLCYSVGIGIGALLGGLLFHQRRRNPAIVVSKVNR
jgi:hypothetical protein